jgi:hypothetical protein
MAGIIWQLPLFLLWPLGALGASVLRYPRGFFKTTVALFCAFYGFTMVFQIKESDADRYIEDFNTVRQQSSSAVFEGVSSIFTSRAVLADPANWLICYGVSRFTSDTRWLFAVVGLVFGFFYAHNLDLLLRHARPKVNKLAWLFLIGFALIIPVHDIYGYRMWLAAHMFFFGAVRVVMQRRYHYLAVAAASVMVHFSFLMPTLLLCGFCLAGRRDLIYLLFATGALFFGNISVSELTPYAHYLGPVVERRAESYSDKSYKSIREKEDADQRWFMRRIHILLYSLYAALVYVFMRYRRQLAPELARLFSFSLLFLGLVGLLLPIPSMQRFAMVWILFVVAFLFFLCQEGRLRGLAVLHWALLPALGLYAVVELRIGMELTGLDLFASNFALAWLFPHEFSLLNLLR